MKTEVYKEKVNTRDELVARIVNSAALIKQERQDDLRRATRTIVNRVEKCVEVDSNSCISTPIENWTHVCTNLFTRNSPYCKLLKYLLFLLKHPAYNIHIRVRACVRACARSPMHVYALGALKNCVSNFCQVCSRWQHRTSGSVSVNERGCWTEWLSVDADVLDTNCLSLANSWNRPCGVITQSVGDDHTEVCRESHRTTH